MIKVIFSLEPEQVAQLHTLYQQEWWTKGRTLEETDSCVRGSTIAIGLVNEGNELVGFARVLTDFTLKALIFDVIIREDQRKTGLGNKLLSLIKSHEKLQRVRHFELYCLPEMFKFYTKHGFTPEVGEIKLMRLVNP